MDRDGEPRPGEVDVPGVPFRDVPDPDPPAVRGAIGVVRGGARRRTGTDVGARAARDVVALDHPRHQNLPLSGTWGSPQLPPNGGYCRARTAVRSSSARDR